MTLARDPLTFPEAVTRIAEHLGYAAAARAVGKSERLIRKWAHPASRAYPTLSQSLWLDTAFMGAGGDGAPLLETYARLFDLEAGTTMASHLSLASAVAVAAREHGEAIDHAIRASLPTATERDVQRAIGSTEEACSAMAVVTRRLFAFLRRGAGPCRETLGGPQ
ncbi:hypothetical protein [Sphingomonas sp.]|jgi:hypothetical protein|uniref:hypothetical protein n=1 Tax=Sphingomonas sp. TaxID=28214 RepID=UPI002ED87B90